MNLLNGKEKVEMNGGVKFLLIAASTVIVIAGLKAASAIIVPVLLALFIATVSFPITRWLREHKVPRWLAIWLTVLVDFAFLAGVITVGTILVGDVGDKWVGEGYGDPDAYKTKVEQKVDDVSKFIEGQLEKWGDENAEETVENYFRSKALEQIEQIDVKAVWSVGSGVVGRLATFFGAVFLIALLTIFMLTEARMFGRRLSAICEARGPDFEKIFSATKDIQRFLGIKTLVSLTTGFLAGFLCWVADLDFFILWGILAFAFNFIPVVGSVIAGVPPTILALLVVGGPQAVAVAIGYIAINMFLGNFVEPMLMGSRFGLSTSVVLLSVLFWGWLWGPVGMLLAVPLTMMAKVAMLNSEDFRWLAVALSKEERSRIDEKVEELREAVQDSEGNREEDPAFEKDFADGVS